MHRRIAIVAMALLMSCVVLSSISCGRRQKRDISTPAKALIGHWVTEEDGGAKDHYYFGDGTLVLAVPGRTFEFTYDVVYSDNKASKIVIEIDTGYMGLPVSIPLGLEKELIFSKNRKSMTEVMDIGGVETTNKWKYVNAKTRP